MSRHNYTHEHIETPRPRGHVHEGELVEDDQYSGEMDNRPYPSQVDQAREQLRDERSRDSREY